jgi:hypothetical protein
LDDNEVIGGTVVLAVVATRDESTTFQSTNRGSTEYNKSNNNKPSLNTDSLKVVNLRALRPLLQPDEQSSGVRSLQRE